MLRVVGLGWRAVLFGKERVKAGRATTAGECVCDTYVINIYISPFLPPEELLLFSKPVIQILPF